MSTLVSEVKSRFLSHFGYSPQVISLAPGRLNIIGEHIDYNDGLVMPVAIDRFIAVAASTNHLDRIRLFAHDLNEEISFNPGETPGSKPDWLPYIFGFIHLWHKEYSSLPGFDFVFSGNIPRGAGLSSSAALEAASGMAIAQLWNIPLEKRSFVFFCQGVEHEFAGVQCGIMDQYASIFGKKGEAILLDCKTVQHVYLPLSLKPYQFLLINTGVSHSLASTGYNDRRQSCDRVLRQITAKFPQITSWRQVELENIQAVKALLDPRDIKRAGHVIREIARVSAAAKALRENDLTHLGVLLFASHEDLSTEYEVSCPELDFLVDEARMEPAVLGARMMGGGFGGCTLNLIHQDAIPRFSNHIQQRYLDKFGHTPEFYFVSGADGAQIIDMV